MSLRDSALLGILGFLALFFAAVALIDGFVDWVTGR